MSDSPARRIAWLVHGHEGYGVQRATLSMTAELQRLGWDTTIVALAKGTLAEECQRKGMEVILLHTQQPPDFRGSTLQRVAAARRLSQFNRAVSQKVAAVVERIGADAVHVRIPTLVGLAGNVARMSRKLCVWHMAGVVRSNYPMGLNRLYYQWLCRRYGIKVLGNSAFTAESFGRWPMQAGVLYLGADQRRFDPTTADQISRDALSIPANAIVFGICARLTGGKGQQRFIEALAQVRSAAPLYLVLAGGATDARYTLELQMLAERVGFADRVRMLGKVDNPERFYGVIDIAVNSAVQPEAFGLSIVEAMLMGKPVLAHALGGPGETVVDAVTGWHVEDASIESYVGGIERALSDMASWVNMGTAARERARAYFTIDIAAQRYVEIVETELMAHKASRRLQSLLAAE